MKILNTIALLAIAFLPVSFAINASPHPFQEKQPDGSLVTLKITGDAYNHHVVDEDGYTVVRRDDDDWLVYADEDETGQVKPSNVKVGEENPREYALKKGLIPPRPEGKERRLRHQRPRKLQFITKGTLSNLVVLLKFADHKDRKVPRNGQITVLFNRNGGHSTLAPTGSVRDVFKQNSYNKLNVMSKVMNWITLPKTESYYADNNYGDSMFILEEAFHYALDRLDSNPNFNFKQFDKNGDGYIDSITFLHSGYGSEWGGTDCDGQTSPNRIWSHMSSMPTTWTSKTGVKVQEYQVSPAMWDTCGSEIGRIGVIAHEIGHFLGLPDHYDLDGGSGIGAYDLMSDAWGFGGDQFYPPHFSAYNKIKLGWTRPTIITSTRYYNIQASVKKPIAYKIQKGYPEGEYLLIENRQPYGFDKKMPQGGLAIWHVDENAAIDEEGYPGQPDWPRNGKHYRVALLQADGLYEMESQQWQSGDAGDLFYLGGKRFITPSNNEYGPFPNTDAYQGGNVYRTGITIGQIGKSQFNMRFKVTMGLSHNTERAPSRKVFEDKLETTFQGGLVESGCMFDIMGKKDLIIRGISVHLASKSQVEVEVWIKDDSFDGFEKDSNAWEKAGDFTVEPNPVGIPTELPFDSFTPLIVKAQEKKALYVTVKDGNGMLATLTKGKPRQLFKQNSDLKVFTGTANSYPFGDVKMPRVWNGGLFYDLPKTIKTKFSGESGQAGIMFDIKTHRNVVVMGFELNIDSTSLESLQIWTKQGSHIGSEAKKEDWLSIGKENMFIQGRGEGRRSRLEPGAFTPIDIAAGSTQAFYITLKENKLRYSYGDATGETFTKNEDLDIHVGTGVRYSFGETFTARVFNGVLNYALI